MTNPAQSTQPLLFEMSFSNKLQRQLRPLWEEVTFVDGLLDIYNGI